MIKIVITRSTPVRLFDRMPLPKSGKSLNLSSKALGLIRKHSSLNKYITNPFVRRVSKIA
jgi:hypothetical protein